MTEDAEQPEEIETASSAARVLLAAAVALLLVAALVSNPLFDRLDQWLAEDPEKILERINVMIAWIAVLSLPVLVAAIFTLRSGLRSVQTARFPPRGMWLIVDTPVVTGSRAAWRGRMLLVAGVLMVVIALGFPAVLWFIVHSIVDAG